MNEQELSAMRDVLIGVHDVHDVRRDLRAGRTEIVEAWLDVMNALSSMSVATCETFGCPHEAQQYGKGEETYVSCWFHHQQGLKYAREDRWGPEERIEWDDLTDSEKERYNNRFVPPVGSRYHGAQDADEF